MSDPEMISVPGTLEHVDPHTLIVGDNVRDDAALDDPFVARVREHGVLQPITAIRTSEGIEVRDGQRRTLAARQAKLATVPVYMLTATGDGPTATAERITQQIVTNDQRTALTEAQRVRGINQLLLAGVSPAKVAKKLSMPRDTVTAAAAAAQSETAMAGLESGQLSLTEATALREFEDDDTALAELTAAAGTPMFEHRVAQLRQDRISAQARAEATADYAERGFTILEHRPEWRDSEQVLLRHLRTPDSQEATVDAVTDPSQWAVHLVEETYLADSTTGEPVEEDDIDWRTEHQPQREPEEGLRHASSVVERAVWRPEYYCLDAEACGLKLADFLRLREPIVHDNGGGGSEVTAEVRAEAEREQRRKVLALNKLGLASQEVRRAFVRDKLLSRKTAIKGAAVFVATCLERAPGLLADHAARQLVGELLGLGGSPLRDVIDKLTGTADARAQVLLLGMVMAALEGRTPKDAWRETAGTYKPMPGATEYLRFLAANGYVLSPIEFVVTGEKTADEVYREATA
jgi:ParB family chromosome partitioning protein